MKKFLIKLAISFCIVAAGAILINPPFKKGPHTSSTFMAAMADKHRRLDSIGSPRILAVGGSSLAFGLNSEALQDSFSMPVVNLALHAGLGLTFILEEAKHVIRSGDIVLLSCEYSIDTKGDQRLEKTAAWFYPEAADYYKINFYDAFKLYVDYTHSRLEDLLAGDYNQRPQKEDTVSVYSREGFNAYGDMVAHLSKGPAAELKGRNYFPADHREEISELQAFCDYARSKNVKVIYLFPPYPVSEYKQQKQKLSTLEADLRKSLHTPIPDSAEDFIYSDSLFYDTVYHLNGKGRAARTARVIECLKQTHLFARSPEL
jgi:hypothetical protein